MNRKKNFRIVRGKLSPDVFTGKFTSLQLMKSSARSLC